MTACFEAIDLAVHLRRVIAAIRPMPNRLPAHWHVLRPGVVYLPRHARHPSAADTPCTRLPFLASITTDAVLRDDICCARMAHSVGDRVRAVPRCDRPRRQFDARLLETRVTVEAPRTVSVPPVANDAMCLLPPTPCFLDQSLAAAGRQEAADGC